MPLRRVYGTIKAYPKQGYHLNRRIHIPRSFSTRIAQHKMSHRRRGVGVGRASASRNKALLTKKADELKAVSLQSAIDTVEKLQVKLADYAKKHRNELQNDPAFRQKFLQLCGPLGVDPLTSPKSFWAKALGVGMGDYYYELAIKVAEVCFATRKNNGGIISVAQVHETLNQRRTKKQAYSIGDIPISVKKLSKLGGGFRMVKLGKSDMIVSIPTELDQDHMAVMEVAQDAEGCVTVDDIQVKLEWNLQRAERALNLLLQEGMAWIDEYVGIKFYWFPSVWKEYTQILGDGGDGDDFF